MLLKNFLSKTSACNFIKKETLPQVFSCEFCEIFKNNFFRCPEKYPRENRPPENGSR